MSKGITKHLSTATPIDLKKMRLGDTQRVEICMLNMADVTLLITKNETGFSLVREIWVRG